MQPVGTGKIIRPWFHDFTLWRGGKLYSFLLKFCQGKRVSSYFWWEKRVWIFFSIAIFHQHGSIVVR
jgi:hypothetical protein